MKKLQCRIASWDSNGRAKVILIELVSLRLNILRNLKTQILLENFQYY